MQEGVGKLCHVMSRYESRGLIGPIFLYMGNTIYRQHQLFML